MRIKSAFTKIISDSILEKSKIGTDNQETRERWLERTLSELEAGKRILDAGAGTTRYRKYCEHLEYVSQDFGEYDGVGDKVGMQRGVFDQSQLDIESDITSIPVDDECFDAIMCIEVLEHVPNPIEALRELSRILKPGGVLIVTAPTCSLTHMSPFFFQTGFSRYFYTYWLDELGYEIDELSPNGSYYAWIAQELRRLPQLSRTVVGHQGISWIRRKAMAVLVDWLCELEEKSANPAELLSFGYHVRATKNISHI